MDTRAIGSALSIVLLFVITAFADGIPVTYDKKAVRGEYTRIVLDRKQMIDVETKRAITLRPDQKSQLQRIAGGPLGNVAVYSSRYNMCTCFDTDVMAIWTAKGVLDFPHTWLFTKEEQVQLEKDRAIENGDDSLGDTEYKAFIIVFDSRGEMYVNGKHQTIKQIESRIDALAKPKEPKSSEVVKWSVIFDPPPPMGERTDRRIAETFHRITAYCKNRNIDTQDWGVESGP